MNLYQFQCLFLFHNTSGYTSKHHLHFMHVTELQHCQNRSQTVTKKDASSSNGYLFFLFFLHPEEGAHLRKLPLHFPLSQKFFSKLALRNRFVHRRPNFLILTGWSQPLLFAVLRYKSDSPFNIINVAIISYSTAIQRVSNLASLSYAYLLLIEKRPNLLILIGLVCIAKFLFHNPLARVLNCLVDKSCP